MLTLGRAYVDEIITHARQDAPNECCGIIAGRNGRAENLYRAVNAAASKYRYEVDSQDLFRIHKDILNNDWDILVIYHSHVATEAYPSATDIKLAYYPDAYYVIVSLADEANPVLRAFRIQDGQVTEEGLELT